MPCWDASSDLLGYAMGWFVVTCVISLIVSTTAKDLFLDDAFLSWFLVLTNAGILFLVWWLGARYDEIDVYDEDPATGHPVLISGNYSLRPAASSSFYNEKHV